MFFFSFGKKRNRSRNLVTKDVRKKRTTLTQIRNDKKKLDYVSH